EDALDRAGFELAGIVDEGAGLPPQACLLSRLRPGPRPPAGRAEERVRLLVKLARLSGVRVAFRGFVERVLAKRFRHASRVPESDPVLAGREQLFQQVVHRQVARGTGEYAFPATDSLADQLDHSRGFAGARRAVDDGEVLRRHRELDRRAL